MEIHLGGNTSQCRISIFTSIVNVHFLSSPQAAFLSGGKYDFLLALTNKPSPTK